jgi:hypothetical protein
MFCSINPRAEKLLVIRELASEAVNSLYEREFLLADRTICLALGSNSSEIFNNGMVVSLRNDYNGAACRSLWQEAPIFIGGEMAGYCRKQRLHPKRIFSNACSQIISPLHVQWENRSLRI